MMYGVVLWRLRVLWSNLKSFFCQWDLIEVSVCLLKWLHVVNDIMISEQLNTSQMLFVKTGGRVRNQNEANAEANARDGWHASEETHAWREKNNWEFDQAVVFDSTMLINYHRITEHRSVINHSSGVCRLVPQGCRGRHASFPGSLRPNRRQNRLIRRQNNWIYQEN